MHYQRGKADWMIRGLPCEPDAAFSDRLRALPYFVNNLYPAIREQWISLSQRATVSELARDDLARLAPGDAVPQGGARGLPMAVVLDGAGVLLGAIEGNAHGARAIEAIEPAPQTIRPDMTHRLAASLLGRHRYILLTDCFGKYLGRYDARAA